MIYIPPGSVEYLYVPVTITAGGTLVEATSVQTAVVDGSDVPTAWDNATVVDGSVRLLFDATALTAGDRRSVWLRVTDAPEDIIRRAGTVEVR